PGTTATMTLPDGRTVPLTQGSMRITEFTVGDLGPQAMPGDLPAATAYTWAAEVSFDEALTAGATTVTFDQPVVVHLDDFIGMGPGALVPVGTYDRATGHWLPEQDGVVVRVLSVTDGLADLDVDGEEPAAADPDLYPLLGITDGER